MLIAARIRTRTSGTTSRGCPTSRAHSPTPWPRRTRATRRTSAPTRPRFVESLQPLLDTIATIEERHPGAPVAYTERVPGYLLDAAGLTVRTPSGFARAVEYGSEPDPGDTQRMNDLVSGHKIDALLYNAQAVTPVTKRLRALAASSGVPVGRDDRDAAAGPSELPGLADRTRRRRCARRWGTS